VHFSCILQDLKYADWANSVLVLGWGASTFPASPGGAYGLALVLEDEKSGKGGVHVAVQERGSTQQQQPDLFNVITRLIFVINDVIQ